jgi:hypothetical protein
MGAISGYELVASDMEPYTYMRMVYVPAFARPMPMFMGIWGRLVITGQWGWAPPSDGTTPPVIETYFGGGPAAVPNTLNLAVCALCAKIYKHRQAQWSDTVTLSDAAVMRYFKELPFETQMAVNSMSIPSFAFA